MGLANFLAHRMPTARAAPQTLSVWMAPTPFESCSQVPGFPALQLAWITAGGQHHFFVHAVLGMALCGSPLVICPLHTVGS